MHMRKAKKNLLARWVESVTLLIGAFQFRWTQQR